MRVTRERALCAYEPSPHTHLVRVAHHLEGVGVTGHGHVILREVEEPAERPLRKLVKGDRAAIVAIDGCELGLRLAKAQPRSCSTSSATAAAPTTDAAEHEGACRR